LAEKKLAAYSASSSCYCYDVTIIGCTFQDSVWRMLAGCRLH